MFEVGDNEKYVSFGFVLDHQGCSHYYFNETYDDFLKQQDKELKQNTEIYEIEYIDYAMFVKTIYNSDDYPQDSYYYIINLPIY